jgi:hypothetical protein
MLKKNFAFAVFLIILTSFGSVNQAFAKGNNSEYFKNVVFQDGGDFLSMLLGETRAEVMSKMPESALEDKTDSYLYYSWKLGNNEYYIDLYFSENDELISIDGYVYFYDKSGNESVNEADKLYKDMRTYFEKKYDEGNEEEADGLKYTYWVLANIDVEVGLTGGEVYWYLYDYSYEDYYDDVEPTPVHLSDLGIGQNGVFMNLELLDGRAKLKSTLDEADFSSADLNSLEYAKYIEGNYYYVNYSFDKDDLLTLIDAQIDFTYDYDYDYDYENEDTNPNYAADFYEEMKAYLNTQFGERKEKEIHGDTKIISWRFNGKELVLGMSYENVYWFYSKDE